MEKLHIVVFPWLAFGHMIPFLEFSKYLAGKGHRISFVSAPRNLQRLPKIPEKFLHLITLVPLPLPHVENLPPDAEATTDISSDKIPYLMQAYDDLQQPLTTFLQSTSPVVDWIIHDFNDWVCDVADRLNIRKAFFSTINAWCNVVVAPSSLDGNSSISKKLVRRLAEARDSVGDTSLVSGVTGRTLKGCDVIAVRTCPEIEAEELQLLQMLYGKQVIPVGLLPGKNVNAEDDDKSWPKIVGWLDKQEKKTVVYVAFGSEVTPSQDQISELALGLELSELPFFWTFRRPQGSSFELPKGFEERTSGRGLVWRSWCPQPKILGHESVGAFVTHCGWSSVIEGLQYGKPLIMFAFKLDQILNSTTMAEMKVGIEIPKNSKDGSIARSSVAETVRLVLKDEAGQIYTEEAKKMSSLIANINLQHQYLDKFGDYLYKHRPTSLNQS